MAEDAVDQASHLAGLEIKRSITETLTISSAKTGDRASGEKLHPDLPYTSEDITRAIRDEMAQTVEDVLARRTRALFLNAKATIEMAPKVAKIMAVELDKDEEWENSQVEKFLKVADSYRIN